MLNAAQSVVRTPRLTALIISVVIIDLRLVL
jgi:hypothetical protein